MKQHLPFTTDVRVSRLSFGTAALHHLLTSRSRQYLLAAACDSGLTHFDTAPCYGFGLAEVELGKFVRQSRNKVTIATKVGLYPPRFARPGAASVLLRKLVGKAVPSQSRFRVVWSLAEIRAEFEESLRRLRCETVDLLLLHEPDARVIDGDEIVQWLDCERAAGRIHAWGLAGDLSRARPWLHSGHPVAAVLQTRDSLERREADSLKEFGRSADLTYGYLSGARKPKGTEGLEGVIRAALQRNPRGSVLVASRSIDHIKQLARVASLAAEPERTFSR